MINYLHIKNYKIINEIKLDNLPGITLLSGYNNVGKSTILEAIFTLFDRNDPNIFQNTHSWRGIPFTDWNPESLWAPSFNNYDLTKVIEIEARMGEESEKITYQYLPNHMFVSQPGFISNNMPIVREKSSETPFVFSALKMEYYHNDNHPHVAYLMLQNGGLQYTSLLPTVQRFQVVILNLRGRENSIDLAKRFGDIDNLGGQNKIIDFLQILEPDLKGLSIAVLGNMPVIHANIGLSRKVPIAYTGDGLTRLLSIILYIISNKDGIVLIDEIESGIHYSKLPLIWRAIARASKQFNCQIICTTHSYECMQAITEGFEDDVKDDFLYVRLDKENNDIFPKYYPYPIFETAINNNWEIR